MNYCRSCYRVIVREPHDCSRTTASSHVDALSLTLATEAITASAPSRTLAGDLVRYGVAGRTSRGRLRVRPGALRFPDDLRRVILTREHDREASRGILAAVHDGPERMRVQLRAADGPEGDAALQEAQDGTRSALSFDVIDATIEGDEITDALVIAIGQVGIPAYDDARIDTIAASLNTPGESMTEQERARLAELAALNSRTAEQEQEFQDLAGRAIQEATTTPPEGEGGEGEGGSGEQVAASQTPANRVTASIVPAVPGGAPAPDRAPARTEAQGGAFGRMVTEVTAGLRARAQGDASTGLQTITAALADVTHTGHSANVDQVAWSGELWSGLRYVPEFADLFTSGPLTNWEGKGWRFTSKLVMQDYAGDKAEIPTSVIGTEDSSYEAARAAVGLDIDRKFFDFPTEGFVAGIFEQARESWEILKDSKVRAYVLANAVAAREDERIAPDPVTNPDIAATPSLLRAAAIVVRALKRRKVGAASWLYVNDEDFFSLMDVAEKDVPAFLELFQIDPKDFRSSEDIPSGTVLGGVKQAATVRELPGSPIRVEAQNLSRAGIDEAFFGYWAIEEHHTSAIAKATFTPPA